MFSHAGSPSVFGFSYGHMIGGFLSRFICATDKRSCVLNWWPSLTSTAPVRYSLIAKAKINKYTAIPVQPSHGATPELERQAPFYCRLVCERGQSLSMNFAWGPEDFSEISKFPIRINLNVYEYFMERKILLEWEI